mmetsp:Transcript_57048/g.150278  ORF Transcript_57048/g.150278 Transcript_57048/m.150278 type:complete len:212 (+) Transcript_57048:2309-2944(+)
MPSAMYSGAGSTVEKLAEVSETLVCDWSADDVVAIAAADAVEAEGPLAGSPDELDPPKRTARTRRASQSSGSGVWSASELAITCSISLPASAGTLEPAPPGMDGSNQSCAKLRDARLRTLGSESPRSRASCPKASRLSTAASQFSSAWAPARTAMVPRAVATDARTQAATSIARPVSNSKSARASWPDFAEYCESNVMASERTRALVGSAA